jgi:tryptophan-rich sensory protein
MEAVRPPSHPVSHVVAGAAAAIALSVAINALVFGLGWNDSADSGAPGWAPPGWVVGAIWVVLFGLMGAARQLADRGGPRTWIDALVVACAAYPLYTGGLEGEAVGLVGNLVTLVLALGVAWSLVRRGEPHVAGLLVPLLAWLSFAAVLTAASLD